MGAILGFILMLLIVGLLGAGLERRRWNKGRCPKCDGTWNLFDMDSQGGRGYKCSCGEYIWISWPGVDK